MLYSSTTHHTYVFDSIGDFYRIIPIRFMSAHCRTHITIIYIYLIKVLLNTRLLFDLQFNLAQNIYYT